MATRGRRCSLPGDVQSPRSTMIFELAAPQNRPVSGLTDRPVNRFGLADVI